MFAPLAGVLLSATSVSGFLVQQPGNAPSGAGVSPALLRAGLTGLSVTLTAGLLYLYNEQRKLNALEYAADVRAEGHRPTEDGDLDLCLSNLGRGAATDLSLEIEASFPDDDERSGLTVEKTPMKRLEQPNVDDVRNEWARPERNYVGPEQYFVGFWTPVPVRWEDSDGDENEIALPRLVGELPDSVDRVRLTVTLDYRDQSDDDHTEQLVDDVLPLEPGKDLGFCFSRGMTYDQYERRNESDAREDPFESLAVHRPQLSEEFRAGQ